MSTQNMELFAEKLQKKEKWQEASVVWDQLLREDSHYSFQATGCRLIATAIQMQAEIPVRRPTLLMVVSGDKHFIMEPKGRRE